MLQMCRKSFNIQQNIDKIVTLILFMAMTFVSYGQDKIDTIYYDKDWKGVSNRTFADYYRLAYYPENTMYKKQLRDYYITGELQSTKGFVTIDKFDDSKSVFDGDVTTYFRNGKVSGKQHYQNGKLNGEFYEYGEDGLIIKKGNYLNGELSGLYVVFLEKGAYTQAEYVNGRPKYDYYVMSNPEGQIVKIKYSDNQPLWESPSEGERKTEYRKGQPWQYYNKNGLTVAQTNTVVKDYGKWYRID